MGDFMHTAKIVCLYFLFNFKSLPHVQVVWRAHMSLYTVYGPSPPSHSPFLSSSSAASSNLFLLMRGFFLFVLFFVFFNSWYCVLNIFTKIRYETFPDCVTLVPATVVVTKASIHSLPCLCTCLWVGFFCLFFVFKPFTTTSYLFVNLSALHFAAFP